MPLHHRHSATNVPPPPPHRCATANGQRHVKNTTPTMPQHTCHRSLPQQRNGIPATSVISPRNQHHLNNAARPPSALPLLPPQQCCGTFAVATATTAPTTPLPLPPPPPPLPSLPPRQNQPDNAPAAAQLSRLQKPRRENAALAAPAMPPRECGTNNNNPATPLHATARQVLHQ